MAGPYDYTINIPQPPAQNFLQSLLGIQQLKGLQQQSQLAEQQQAFAAQQQPLQLQQLKEQIAASQASQAHLGAATTGQNIQNQISQLNLADKQLVSSTLKNYFSDESKTVKDLAPIIPLLDATAVENLGKAEQIRVNNEVTKKLDEGKEITASDIRGWANRQTLLKAPEQQQFQQSFLAMSPAMQSAAKGGMINVINAAFSGNMDVAKKSAQDVQDALINSKDTSPAAKSVSESFGKLVQLMDTPNLPPGVLALNAVNAANLVGDQKFAEDALKVVKEHAAEIKAGTERPLPSSILKENQAIDKKVEAANEMADKLAQAAEAMRELPSVGSVGEWWTNVKPKIGFGENPEIAVRTNAAQLAGLGMLGSESSAMGGAIRSNVQFQYATGKLPDAWSAPKALAERLSAQAEVQRRLAKLMTIDAEWNSAFRGNPKATKDEQIIGMDVAPGTTKAKFKEMAAKQLFPPKETLTSSPTPSTGGGTPAYAPPAGITIKSVR
jgi:hypothetical protein